MSDTQPLISFQDVSFTWPDSETGEIATREDGSPVTPVFDEFTADIPSGFISLTGPNGSGKTSFMLLAGGRIMPTRGRVELLGHNTRVLSGVWADETGKTGSGLDAKKEHSRNLICSFLYQNMEFDVQDDETSCVGSLLEFVYENGGHLLKNEQFFLDVISTFELEHLRSRKLNALSKGEIQRVLLSFSALYGSRVLMMDEPLFAMEQYQKEKALEFFSDLYHTSGVSIVVSLHELSLSRKYADTVMLFYPDRRIDLGSPDEILQDEALESSYGVPAAMLYDSENLTRQAMLEHARIHKEP